MGMGGGARAIPQELDATAEGRPDAHLGMAWPSSPRALAATAPRTRDRLD